MYSSIFFCKSFSRSLGDRSSTTKSGHNGGNCFRCLSERAFHRSFLTQDMSGIRLAPFGRLNSVDESKPLPLPSLSTQLENFPVKWKDRKSTRLNSSHSQISYAVF